MDIREDLNILAHEGTPRHSGRYPWGSGKDPHQHSVDFMSQYNAAKRKGLSEAAIAKAWGYDSTTELRARVSYESTVIRREEQNRAQVLRDRGMSPTEIGRQLGINESTVRSRLDPERQRRANVLQNIADELKKEVDSGALPQVGLGVETMRGISKEKMATALVLLKQQGYEVHELPISQVGRIGQSTPTKILCPPGMTFSEAFKNLDKVAIPKSYSEDGGETFRRIQTPQSVSSKKLAVRYGPDGGSDMDGVIELRRGVPELSLNGKAYAQVRIAVDGSHFLKGMAIYADDLPEGMNLRFNTNKKDTGNKLDALKEMKSDPDNPFGSMIRQRTYIGKDGKEHLSAINVLGSKEGSYEEGGWADWSKRISSQVLSKQNVQLAKQQLDLTHKTATADFDEIMKLTNPTVRKKMLQSYADECDKKAVDLQAAAMPRQASQVLLPYPKLKDNEVYAPSYNHGEKVVLIRYPHAGTFEIPELTVNNRHPGAKKLFGDIRDGVAVNPKVAAQLSGADFDGDSVTVIPNNRGLIKTRRPLQDLVDFDTKRYVKYDGMKTIDGGIYNEKTGKVDYPKGKKPDGKQQEMGKISNLITDMQVQGAPEHELVRAVKHSMVVIDAEKHVLDYKRSEAENNIKQLRQRYQSKEDPTKLAGGASTIISKASSELRVPERTPRTYRDHPDGPVDRRTGEKMYTPTGKRIMQVVRDKDGNIMRDSQGRAIKVDAGPRITKTTKMAEVRDATTLVRDKNNAMEMTYANHANRMKALANQARLASLDTPNSQYSPSAAKAYSSEVASLNAKLRTASLNKPLERQAQIIANLEISAKRKDNPQLSKEELKKLNTMSITKARARVGREKSHFEVTPREWEAIQSGAISSHKLSELLRYTDEAQIKEYAMPRTKAGMVASKRTMATAMLSRGYTRAEVASQLGVSVTTLDRALDGE